VAEWIRLVFGMEVTLGLYYLQISLTEPKLRFLLL